MNISAGVGLTGINTVLILTTIYFGYHTHAFQIKTSVREALEELDHYSHRKAKFIPMLKDFKYSITGDSYSIISLQIAQPRHNDPRSSSIPDNAIMDFQEKNYLKINHVEEANFDEKSKEVTIKVSSTDAVDCRNATKLAMQIAREDREKGRSLQPKRDYEYSRNLPSEIR